MARPFEVADSITMNVLHEQRARKVTISPNGDRFFFVESSGLIDQNAREFRLRVFSSDRLEDFIDASATAVLHDEHAVRIVSSSNRDAIADARWVDNGQGIAFLGAQGNQEHQVHVFDLESESLFQVTHAEHGVVAFDYRQGTCIFAVRSSRGIPDYSAVSSVVVTGESLPAFIFPDQMYDREQFATYVIRPEWSSAKAVSQPEPVLGVLFRYYISPDGRYAVAVMPPARSPELWREYLVPEYEIGGGELERRSFQYQLVDLKTLDVRPIVDAPVAWIVWNRSEQFVRWSDDGSQLLLASTMAPLNEDLGANPEVRRRKPIVIVQEINAGRLADQHEIPFFDSLSETQTLIDGSWNAEERAFEVVTTTGRSLQSVGQPRVRTRYSIQYSNGNWAQSGSGSRDVGAAVTRHGYYLWIKEDANSPPELWATNIETGDMHQVLDINPHLASLWFAEVQSITWLDDTGKEWSGSLLLPDCSDEGPAPLVVEMKFGSPSTFRPDGPYTTAFASQALAGAGIAVLELNSMDPDTLYSPLEAPTQLRGIESAIAHLADLGAVDPNRVGLIGFSRTAFYARYALTHSDLEFAAATVADGVDGGYVQYNAFTLNYFGAHEDGGTASLYGAPPYGPGIERWLEAAPTFNTHRVRAPVRIEAIGQSSVLQEWEFYSALKILKLPVEMVYLPHGTHVLVKPKERLVSQQGNVDWFRYWLMNEKNDEADAQQYANWDRLRENLTRHKAQPRPPLLDWLSEPKSEPAGQ